MANRIDDNRLLPCPFCGEPAAIWYFPQHDRPILKEAYYVGCTNDNCGCELERPGAFKSLDDALSAWNMRAKEPTTKNDLGVDYISRADVNRLICEYRDDATETGNERDLERAYGANAVGELISELPSVTPQLSSGTRKNSKKLEKDFGESDCTSRKAVLDAIDSKAWEFCDYLISKGRNDEQKPVSHFADNLRECVREEIPSVTPQEPRKGYWLRRPHVYGVTYCSICDFELKIDNTNYCPNCGAKMESEKA